jgi:hypothetical protein
MARLGLVGVARVALVLATFADAQSLTCATRADCFMNGECNAAGTACVCDAPVRFCWVGLDLMCQWFVQVVAACALWMVVFVCPWPLPQWGGEVCNLLQFQPVTFPQGYGMTPNLTRCYAMLLPCEERPAPCQRFQVTVRVCVAACLALLCGAAGAATSSLTPPGTPSTSLLRRW